MIRHSKLDINYLNNLKGYSGLNKYKKINGVIVKVTSQRYEVFKNSIKCVKCGIEGKFLAIEKANDDIKKYHINMYGIDENGNEVLMTKDHIIPKSKGGTNSQDNYQTMCSRCNSIKGNGENVTLRNLFNEFIYNKTSQDINEIDILCNELNIKPNDFWFFYLKHIDDFSETQFLTELISYFHWYLTIKLEETLLKYNIKFNYFYFSTEDNYIYLSGGDKGYEEFKNKIINANFKIKQKLMKNKIFKYFMNKTKTKIFTKKQIRTLKLINIDD